MTKKNTKEQELKCYCDTSFIFNYWEAYEENNIKEIGLLNNTPPHHDLIRDVIRSESKIERLKPLRRIIEENESNLILISSVLALFEIYEKHSEWNMKTIITELFGVDRVLNMGRKQIGEIINKISKSNNDQGSRILSVLKPGDLRRIIPGIEFKDVENFTLNTQDFYNYYLELSLFQVGPLDILHLITAKELGAKYFLTFDSDFDRVKEVIKEYFELEIIYNNHEIEKFLDLKVQII